MSPRIASAIIATLLASTTFAQSTQPTSKPFRPELLQQSMSQLLAEKFPETIATAKEFQAGLPKQIGKLTDPNWINSYHLQAVAYMRLGQFDKARNPIERVYASGKSNRSILLNTALSDVMQKRDAARAVKNLRDYVTAHPDDEFALNLWGVALNTLATTGKPPTAAITQAQADYAKANALLEASRPGFKHYGTQWLDEHQFFPIAADIKHHQFKVDAAKRELDDATVWFNDCQVKYRNAAAIPMGKRGTRDQAQFDDSVRAQRLSFASEELEHARQRLAQHQSEWQSELAAMPQPTWTLKMEPVDPEMITQ